MLSYYPYLLLAMSCAGVFSNVTSLFVFVTQRFRKKFHQLLVLLALYDFMVSTSWISRKYHGKLVFVTTICKMLSQHGHESVIFQHSNENFSQSHGIMSWEHEKRKVADWSWYERFFQVVVLCSMIWALPPIWPLYKKTYYPFWSIYLYPIVQIVVMSSVYCTIVMSWERYVRICLDSYYLYFGSRKFCAYILFIIIFPILFYIPKFFEVSNKSGVNFSHHNV